MFENLSFSEAHHVLTDFFEIHTEVAWKNARKRARLILEAIEAGETVALGTLPTLRVGESVVSFLPDDYDPGHIFLLRKEELTKGYTKKIKVKK